VTVRAVGIRAGALWLLAAATAALVACIVAATPAGDAVRASFDAYLHHRPGDPGRAVYIFARNATVAGLFLACAWIVARQPGQRRALDVFVIGACAVFVLRFAVMVGGFGWPVVRYMATYGPIEAAGLAVAAAAYLGARNRSALAVRDLAPAGSCALALVLLAAVLETYVGGVL
jgi:hypothetical protein